MFREARLILPVPTAKQVAVSRWLAGELCRRFGGYTSCAGRGGWDDPEKAVVFHEPILIYDIAMDERSTLELPPPAKSATDELIKLALEMGRRAEQRCVYLRLPSGEVKFLDTRVPREAGDAAEATARLVA